MKVLKKDNTLQDFIPEKIKIAANKAAHRCMIELTDEEHNYIVNKVISTNVDTLSVAQIHDIVIKCLYELNKDVGHAYDMYRNYKVELSTLFDEVYNEANRIRYQGDVSNANSDATLVSTKRALTYDALSRKFYKKFFLSTEENEAINDGYIYPHDQNARLDAPVNCCLIDMQAVLKNGFTMGNIHYNEPKSLEVAFGVLGDVILSTASQQYGGFTVCEIDKVLEPYAQKTYNSLIKMLDHKQAMQIIHRTFEQGFQALEMKLNSVGSSRGDYPFITFTFGLGKSTFAVMANKTMLAVRSKGQGEPGKERPVLFPKLVFLYDKELHGEKRELEAVFNVAIKCTAKCMYPDYLSLTGDGIVAEQYKLYGLPVSPMGKL